MREICHRCGGDLPSAQLTSDGRSPFCPHCGSPQLLLSDYTEPVSTGADSTGGLAEGSTSITPPPRHNRIDWPMAMRSAILVAVTAAVFSAIAARVPKLSPVASIWVVSASLTTLALYQRRRPLATMNASVGARIGLLVGIMLVVSLAATLSAGLCVARYKLHVMSDFDAEMALAMKTQVQQLASTRPVPPESLALINSPQFRTAMMLISFSLGLFGVLLISIFGGAVGGLLRTRRFGNEA